MTPLTSYLPIDRRLALADGLPMPENVRGTALVADTRDQYGRHRLIGRRHAGQIVRDALDAVTGGRQPVLLIRGEEGIGKTRLLASFVRLIRERGLDRHSENLALNNLGCLDYDVGDFQQGERHGRAALALAQKSARGRMKPIESRTLPCATRSCSESPIIASFWPWPPRSSNSQTACSRCPDTPTHRSCSTLLARRSRLAAYRY